MIKNTTIKITIEYAKYKLAIDEIFINNPESFLVRACDRKSKEIRNNEEMNLTNVEIEYKGKYTIIRGSYLHDKALIETARIINAI